MKSVHPITTKPPQTKHYVPLVAWRQEFLALAFLKHFKNLNTFKLKKDWEMVSLET